MRSREYPARERGDSDCDQAYRFGHVPTSGWPYPFTLHQFVRLVLLKLRMRPDGQPLLADQREPSPLIEAPTNVAMGGD